MKSKRKLLASFRFELFARNKNMVLPCFSSNDLMGKLIHELGGMGGLGK